jgi:2-polyprenyl-3-methyl-5-hydroxy-6-metoxy-1,4-benzoquinol methylase
VPALRAGGGTGHLRRCLKLAARLGEEAELLLEAEGGEAAGPAPRTAEEQIRRFGFDPLRLRWRTAAAPPERWPIVLLDRRATLRDELARYRALGLVVGLDEGGPARRFTPYLVDALPGLAARPPANLSSLGLLDLPERRRSGVEPPFRKVLLAFGGEDSRDLTGRLLRRLLAGRLFPPEALTAVVGPRFRPREWPAGVRRLERPADLAALLHGYDLVFTSFGLTCFEALAAGVPVIAFNPTRYHRRLCRAAGIPEIGVGRPSRSRLAALLARPQSLAALPDRFHAGLRPPDGPGQGGGPTGGGLPSDGLSSGGPSSGGPSSGGLPSGGLPSGGLEELLRRLHPAGAESCPACGRGGNPAAERFPFRTYFTCRGCGLVYLLSFPEREKRYGSSYFFEEYRRQYGKTYLEDFESIRAAGAGRLAVIERLLDGSSPGDRRLLDVGCAYGPFLQAARERGFQAAGVDVSPEAVAYVTGTLGIPARVLDFQAEGPPAADTDGTSADTGGSAVGTAGGTAAGPAGPGGGPDRFLEPGSWDAITFWFVIEHFQRLDLVLQRAARLLAPGGILAFATPNARGISSRKGRRSFLAASPEDHFTVWSPRSARKVLRRYGLRVRRIRVTGHHPQRFPAGILRITGLRPKILEGASRLLGWGDTFEVYAQKTAETGR